MYNGYIIPKESTAFMAVWAMPHNESLYPDHEKYNPDRFLNHSKLANKYGASPDYANGDKSTPPTLRHEFDSLSANYFGHGAGRRSYPGVHLAERNMWRITAKLLWAFNIYEAIELKPREMTSIDENAYNSSILVSTFPFKVRVVPRSQERLDVVRREKAKALQFLSKIE
ncbi:cytochrome P450 [Lepidopterella palustris CBS 459.81]|uniref:Cytochrome P450 n=1 Tax=Lepidopterella palustris CBS 459.81 TaxID=1314670 RepID=A0A8E2E3W0_9PEZI|nr:cytochrome P450 [Lepidopterella palustris CBS 459.81]